jgi:hypothetical protein
MPKKMTVDEITAVLQAEKSDAMSAEKASKLSEDRAKAMDYYLGDMEEHMPSTVDRSAAVSMDVADTVEGLMPSMMEIFYGGDNVVEFEPVGPEDEEAADQETEYVNYVFKQMNDGYRVIYSMVKDALLQKVGICKVWWEDKEVEEEETYEDLDDGEFAALVEDDEVEITEHEEVIDMEAAGPLIEALEMQIGMPLDLGFEVEVPEEISSQLPKRHTVTLMRKIDRGQCRVEPVPPEEFGITRRAKTLRDADYTFHETERTISELLDEGYDSDVLDSIGTTGLNDNSEAMSRNTVDDHAQAGQSGLNKLTRLIKVTEHFCLIDYEGKNKPCMYKIVTGGDSAKVLYKDGQPDIEKVRRHPFAAMTPIIMPHRFFGQSVADRVMDIQRINTSITRSLLDNMYLANNQRVEIAESHAGPNTIDDLLSNRPGGVVRTKTPGGLVPLENTSIGPFGFPLLEHMMTVREWRTGVTKQGMGLDPNALQNVGENALLDAANAARQKQKLIARTFAETGIRDLFLLLHDTIRANDAKGNTIRLRGEWVTVSPREWKTRSNLVINVGLGEGTKPQQLAFIGTVLQIQEKAMAAPHLGLVEPKNVYNTLKKYIELGGLKSVEPYFLDPEEKDPNTGQLLRPPQPPPPDPKMVEMEMRMKLEEKQAEADMVAQEKKTQADITLKREEFMLKRALAILEAKLKAAEQNRQLMIDFAEEGTEGMEGPAVYDQMIKQLTDQSEKVQAALADVTERINDVSEVAVRMAAASGDVDRSVREIQAINDAPAEVIRDDSQRIVGVRKGGKTKSVVRDPKGTIAGLQ